MEIYSELIKSVEQGSSLELAANNLKSKLIHLFETTKQEIDLFKQQEILLQIACKHYDKLAQNFPSRSIFFKNFDSKDMLELYKYHRLPHSCIIVAEAFSTFLNIKEKWQSFYGKFNICRTSILMDVDYNDLSEQTLHDLELIVNAHRNNANNICNASIAAGNLFSWLITTYDWAITIRDHFPHLSSFKEIDKLVDKEMLEYNYLEAVSNKIKNKEIELDFLENIQLPIIKKILG